MIDCIHPSAWLLLIPIAAAYRFWALPGRPLVTTLRALFAIAVVGLLTEPFSRSGVEGRDLVLLVDRSRSVPQSATRRVQEITRLLADHSRPGDRVAMVSFGRDAVVDVVPTENFVAGAGAQPSEVDRDATDLAEAIERGLALIPPGRPGSLLLVSDGENTGAEAASSARAALRRSVRIDAIPLRRDGAADLAVEEVGLPGEVGIGEPFQFSAWIRTDRATKAPVRLLRDGVVIAEGETQFRSGLNRVVFRDRLAEQGIHRYEVEVRVDGDRVPENDRAQAVVRVVGPSRVLCVTPGGRTDRLVRALRASGIEVAVAAPGSAPLTIGKLDGFRSVVLENVPAGDLPAGSLSALAAYVRDGGGGLLLTGGPASFGVGGYHRTEVEEVLPVTMEVRQEQRRFALAMAVVLDRSGSMGVGAGGAGQTKMDLANLGTIAAAELLGPMDELSVIAVDSSPHVVVPLTVVDDRPTIIGRVSRIESGGGGIFVYEGLLAAVEQLEKATAANKHIVLFADAADAEAPGAYDTLLPKLVRAGVTVSVIGLGSVTDSDAVLLQDIARLGASDCTFVSDATDLPRVFAQQTISVVRSSFVEQATAVDVLPDLLGLGELAFDSVPAVGGYSVAYLEAGASIGMQTADDVRAPLFSFWQHGLGRSAAFLGEIDGEASGAFGEWRELTDFLATTVRWLGGSDAGGVVFADLRRRGHRAVLSVDVDESDESELGQIEALVTGPDGPERVFLQRKSATRLEATMPLTGDGVYRAAVRLGDGSVLRVPPVVLPYSPEFEPRPDPEFGMRTLQRICSVAGGRVDPPVDAWFDGPRTGAGIRELGWIFATLALLLLIAEIATRRLDLQLPQRRSAASARAVRSSGSSAPTAAPTGSLEPHADPQPAAPPARPEPDGIAAVLARAKAKGKRRS